MTRTRSLAPQASINTASGWTVTVTHAGLFRDPYTFHAWRTTITNPVGGVECDSLGLATMAAYATAEPNPMEALERVRDWLPDMLPGTHRLELDAIDAAIAGMYGDDPMSRTCEACLAEPGEPCGPDCLAMEV